MSGVKRPAVDQDPDYEQVRLHHDKRQRLYEEGAKEVTVRRIENILRCEFAQEKQNKESEILRIDERLNKARMMADRLRACIVASFYSRTGTPPEQAKPSNKSQPSIHPTIKKYLGKAPLSSASTPSAATVKTEICSRDASESEQNKKNEITMNKSSQKAVPEIIQEGRCLSKSQQQNQGVTSRFKVKKRVIVGNLSKYIPVDKREDNDRSTHRWMVYVRGPAEEPHIHQFMDKVWFFLHPSYKPNDLVEIRERPFHLTRRGWGEFPVRVQLHFKDTRNKRVDVIHNLKLDRTYTGLQNLGAETVVDIELERDSIGLPQPSPLEPLPPLPAAKPAAAPRVKTDCDVMLEALTTQQNGAQDAANKVTIKQENVDLSIVKIEPLDVGCTVDVAALRSTEGVASPVSAPRPDRLNPITVVLGAPDASSTCVANPASGATTPVKEGSGWTRVQIKSESSSPCTSPVSKKGWQNISTLTSPIKCEVASDTLSSPVSIKTEPGQQKVTSSPVKIILTQGGAVSQLAQGQRVVTQGPIQNRIRLVAGQPMSGVSLVNQSTSSLLHVPSATAVQVQSPCQVPSASHITNPMAVKQPTVYIRCRDNSGKVYLIPQHVLNKTAATGAATTVSQPKNAQLQRMPLPMGMAILSPGGTTRVPSSNQSNIVMGKVQSLTSLGVNQRSGASIGATPVVTSTATQPLPSSSSKQSSMTTTIKNAGKTATLTYVLATSAATPTTQTPTAGNQIQKVVAAQGQNLVLASAVSQAQTQSLILTAPSTQKSRPGTPLTGSKPAVSANSRPCTPVAVAAAGSDAGRSQFLSTSLTENIRIIGGNIVTSSPKGNSVTGSPKASNIVLINQAAVSQQGSGIQQAAKGVVQSGGIQSGGVSLLTGLTGIRPAASWPKATIVAQTPACLPTTGVSLLSKTSPMPAVHQISPRTVFIKQEPGGQWTPRHTGATLVPGQRSKQPQLLLVPTAANPSTPSVLIGKKTQQVATPLIQEQVAAPSSLLTTIGNQKVIVQLFPKQVAVSANQGAGHTLTIAANQRNTPPDTAKASPGGDDWESSQSVFHQVQTKKVVTQARPIDLSRYSCVEELVRALVRLNPIVKAEADRSAHPYCAQTEGEFLSWKVGKRRAAEWCRAAIVQRCVREALSEATDWPGDTTDRPGDTTDRLGDATEARCRAQSESVWSKKRIVWWCRNHSYTPWDAGLKRLLNKPTVPERYAGCGDDDRGDDAPLTLTDAAPLLESLAQREEKLKDERQEMEDDEEEDIDIISCDVPWPVKVKLESPAKAAQTKPAVCLQISPTAHFVRHMAAQIGVQMRPVEVDVKEAPGVRVHAVEDMIMAVTQTLMGDVIRKARALLLEQFMCGDELRARHIVHALTTIPVCDLLTNSGLGTPSKAQPGTRHPPA